MLEIRTIISSKEQYLPSRMLLIQECFSEILRKKSPSKTIFHLRMGRGAILKVHSRVQHIVELT